MLLPTLDRFEAATQLLKEVLIPTPLVPLRGVGPGSNLWLKPEILQCVGSFKIRGVFHAVARMTSAQRAGGLETVSAGNTAQALAWAARHFGVAARSVMPEGAPQAKLDAVQDLGGEVLLMPREELFAYMRGRGWEQGARAFVHPWTEPEVWVGHGTLGLELMQQIPEMTTLYIPLGGGGLLAGVASALLALKAKLRIVAVEPEACAAYHAARQAGAPVEIECSTLCDGVAVPFVTDEMFPLLNELVDEVQLVSEAEVHGAMRLLAFSNSMVAEGAGALALAAALKDETCPAGPRVCLVTGGSIDPQRLLSVLAGD